MQSIWPPSPPFRVVALGEGITPALDPGPQERERFAAEMPLVVLPSAHGAVCDWLENLSVARRADNPFDTRVLPREKHRLVRRQLQECAQPADLGREVRGELFIFQLMGVGSQQ